MALDNGLTPEEQRFFETGQLEVAANPGTPDPVALAGLGTPAPQVTPAVVPPVVPPVVETPPASIEPSLDMAEILRRNYAEAQQRVVELEAQIKAAQKPVAPDPGPDPAIDPLGALMHKLETLQGELKGLQTNMSTQQTQQQQLTAFQAFQSNVNQLKADFARTTPDFDAAYNHLRAARIADLKAFGMTEKQINESMFREEVSLAEAAINQGRNPAAAVYEMAKRHGYTPTANPNPAAATTPSAKLDQIAAAQAAAKPLASQPGTDTDVTLDGLKAASDADLNKMVLDPKMWAKIAGSTEYPL